MIAGPRSCLNKIMVLEPHNERESITGAMLQRLEFVGMSEAASKDDVIAAPADDGVRFLVELEFVQNLINVRYLHYLATHNFFDDDRFMAFLRYLRYWKEPEYIQHMLFPQSLVVLDKLLCDDKRFRKELRIPQFVDYCHAQQGSHWLAFNAQIEAMGGTGELSQETI